MKMRYCFLISAVISAIIGVVLSYFIEIWASIFCSIFSGISLALIIYIRSSKAYKMDNSKFKGVNSTILCGLLELFDVVFVLCYKGERTIILAISLGVIFVICLSIQFLILLRENKNDTK